MRTVNIEICENCNEHKWHAYQSQNKFVNKYQQRINSNFVLDYLFLFKDFFS